MFSCLRLYLVVLKRKGYTSGRVIPPEKVGDYTLEGGIKRLLVRFQWRANTHKMQHMIWQGKLYTTFAQYRKIRTG